MHNRIIYLVALCVAVTNTYAQDFSVIEETDTYAVYELTNAELATAPPFEVLAPAPSGGVEFEILAQEMQEVSQQISAEYAAALNLHPASLPVVEVLNVGAFRGQRTASVRVHVARYSDSGSIITKRLLIKIPKLAATLHSPQPSKLSVAEDHPLANGTWYKLSIPKRGIYQLTAEYLQNLGFDLNSIDPRNIQLWGTDGQMLPELNNVPRSVFTQLPIIVEGEDDGRFDSNDRVLFYGNSPHQITRTGSTFTHQIHPYSDSTYVYLTIGNQPGSRLRITAPAGSSTRTISTFDDFIWLEQELTKTEGEQRSGRYWLGQQIPSTAQNQYVPIFRDTLPGILNNATIKVSGKLYARSLNTTTHQLRLNDKDITQFTISRIYDYTSHDGNSANYRTFTNISVTPTITNGILEITERMSGGDNGATAFVDYLRLIVPRSLTAKNNQLFFTPPYDGLGETVTYFVNGFSSTPIALDVKNPTAPLLLSVTATQNGYHIQHTDDPENRILVQSAFYTPAAAKKILNQNLHGITSYPDYIIVTATPFEEYAQELAQYRAQRDGLFPLIVTQDQILNEFSGGAKDPTAIRDFMKFLWDRALADGQRLPRYLLLFGDTTYDTKNIVDNAYTNYVLTYQSKESIHRIDSYGSDDYFGFMDDGEGDFTFGSRIDIGIGRIPAQTQSEARAALDKIYIYENPETFGDWQNLVTFVGDDDFPNTTLNRDLHVWNADGTADRMDVASAGLRLKKIYLFDYQEEITGAGRQFPDATKDFIETLNNGTLVLNYSGHGNTTTLTDEELFLADYIPSLTNHDRLAIFVTATCQFGRYDDINAQSGAEQLFFAENGGAIAAFTTTRVVYTNASATGELNFALNIALSEKMLERDEHGAPQRLGDIYLQTKNTTAGASENSRRFILLGDPAVRIALPDYPAVVTKINDTEVTELTTPITIKALDKVTLTGHIQTYEKQPNTAYNGELSITLLDAKRRVSLPQDLEWIPTYGCNLYRNTSRECTYDLENDVIFKGKAGIEQGTFTIEFVVPKDISFSSETGRIVLFASGDTKTAGGSFTNVVFNGLNEHAINDNTGPELDVFLNDPSFFNGDLSGNNPTLIVELTDTSGINTTGTGVGHEITATIDTQPMQTFVLNDYFEGAINDFSSGRIEYPLGELPSGSYSVKVRAWDVHNNPSEKSIFFDVADSDELVIQRVYNYPNPMNNHTAFTFEHNQQGNPLEVDIRIFTLSGKPVQHLKEYITNTTSSYASIPWNGRDRNYDRLGNGTYIYVLRVTADTPEGKQTTEKIEKLVIIR